MRAGILKVCGFFHSKQSPSMCSVYYLGKINFLALLFIQKSSQGTSTEHIYLDVEKHCAKVSDVMCNYYLTIYNSIIII